MVPAPLAEAESERFDLGMVLESLIFDDDKSYLRAESARWRSRVGHGPPVPVDIVRQRMVTAHRTRSAPLSRCMTLPRLTASLAGRSLRRDRGGHDR